MVGAVYHVLLSHLYQQEGLQAVCNRILHYTIPPLFPLPWWFAVPRHSLVWSDAWRILSYPLAYLVYLIARGEMTGLYPYFFIDVPRIGYPQALLNAAGLSAVFIAAGLLLIAVKGTVRPPLPTPATAPLRWGAMWRWWMAARRGPNRCVVNSECVPALA